MLALSVRLSRVTVVVRLSPPDALEVFTQIRRPRRRLARLELRGASARVSADGADLSYRDVGSRLVLVRMASATATTAATAAAPMRPSCHERSKSKPRSLTTQKTASATPNVTRNTTIARATTSSILSRHADDQFQGGGRGVTRLLPRLPHSLTIRKRRCGLPDAREHPFTSAASPGPSWWPRLLFELRPSCLSPDVFPRRRDRVTSTRSGSRPDPVNLNLHVVFIHPDDDRGPRGRRQRPRSALAAFRVRA